MVDITATINPHSGTTARISSPTSTGPQKVSVTIPATLQLQNNNLQLKLLGDVVTTGIEDGALLQYRSSDEKFVARTELATDTGTLRFNGGTF